LQQARRRCGDDTTILDFNNNLWIAQVIDFQVFTTFSQASSQGMGPADELSRTVRRFLPTPGQSLLSMKQITKQLVIAIGVSVAAALPARAQFENYCIMGNFQVCASVQLASIGNQLTMTVWNMEGTLGGSHTITSVGLYHAGSNYDWQRQVDTWDVRYWTSATSSSSIKSAWSEKRAGDIETLGGINLELSEGTRSNSGIVGCTNLSGGTKWRTCNSFDGAPFVQFTFNFKDNQSFSLDGVELRWHSQQVGPNQEYSLKCDTGGAGDYPDCIPPTVVPEPATMVLVGTGLAGVFGAARRRRKALAKS
jgi:hypothetical protein